MFLVSNIDLIILVTIYMSSFSQHVILKLKYFI